MPQARDKSEAWSPHHCTLQETAHGAPWHSSGWALQWVLEEGYVARSHGGRPQRRALGSSVLSPLAHTKSWLLPFSRSQCSTSGHSLSNPETETANTGGFNHKGSTQFHKVDFPHPSTLIFAHSFLFHNCIHRSTIQAHGRRCLPVEETSLTCHRITGTHVETDGWTWGEAERYRDEEDRDRQRVKVAVWSPGSSAQVGWALGAQTHSTSPPGGVERELSND